MKYCTNCGEEIKSNEDKHCSNCFTAIEEGNQSPPVEAVKPESEAVPTMGADTPEPTPEVKPEPEKKGLKKGAIIAIAAGALAVLVIIPAVLIGLVVSGAFTSPVQRFQIIQRQSIFEPLVAVFEAEEDTRFSTDLTLTASVDMDATDIQTMMISSMLEQISVEMNIDAGIEDAMLGLGINAFGGEILSAMMVMDEDMLGFYIPTLDDNYYTISLDAFSELTGGLEASAFTAGSEWDHEDVALLIERYADIILSTVNSDNLEASREVVSLFDGREEVNATVYTFTPSEEDFHEMLTAIVREIRDYEDFYYYMFASQQNDWLLEFQGYSSTREAWESLLRELEDSIDEEAATMAASNFTWRTVATRSQLLKQEISTDEFLIRYEGLSGRGGERTDWFTIRAEDMEISVRNEATIERFAVDGTTRIYYEDSFRFGRMQEVLVVEYSIDLNQQSILGIPYGNYTAQIFDEGREISSFSIEVNEGRDGGSDHLLSIYGMDDFGIRRVQVNLHSTDEPSRIEAPNKRPVDLSRLSPEQIEDIFEEMLWQLESLFSAFDMF